MHTPPGSPQQWSPPWTQVGPRGMSSLGRKIIRSSTSATTRLARVPSRPLMMAGPKRVEHTNRFQSLIEEEEKTEALRSEMSLAECATIKIQSTQKKRKMARHERMSLDICRNLSTFFHIHVMSPFYVKIHCQHHRQLQYHVFHKQFQQALME